MTTTPKNDCVFCTNETGGRGTPLFCEYYRQNILNPQVPGEKGAFRQQTSCQGFQISPHMATTWEREFGRKR